LGRSQKRKEEIIRRVMARPFKSGVDYFPLDVVSDDKLKLIQAQHKIVGFGIVIKLYQKIYASNYWIKWDKKANIVFSDEVNVDINEVNAIINSCLEWDLFNKNIFDDYTVLTSRGIQKRFFEIVARRSKVSIVEEFLLIEVPIRDKQILIIEDINSINECKSTQSKVKESKAEEKETIPQNEFAEDDEEFYLTKKKRKLKGKRLTSFLLFWEAFNYKKDKAAAADSWIDIPQLTDKLVGEICEAAKKEAQNRPAKIANGQTPIFAQGWLTARRWEDEEIDSKKSTSETNAYLEKLRNKDNE
jgi:hypothetical protein